MSEKKQITVNFITPKNEIKKVVVPVGISLLEASQYTDETALEGSCGGSLACSTCHVILDEKWYDKIDQISDEENDTLDMAFNVQPTSRLGCQIILTEQMDGIIAKIPEYSD